MTKPDPSVGGVIYERVAAVAYLRLARPGKLNSFTNEMLLSLRTALRTFDADDGAWVAIIHGQGGSFSAGADLASRQIPGSARMAGPGGTGGADAYFPDYFFRVRNFKPIIAATHGYTLGLGLRLALLCDYIVAAEDTAFRVTETSRGLDPSPLWGHLQRRGQWSFALDVATSGRYWSGAEGHAAGVVDRLAAPGSQLECAERLAGELEKMPPLSVRAVIEAARQSAEAIEADARRRRLSLHLTDDFREALLAHREDRPPSFTGR